jgi:hypothetical protein
VLAFRRGSAAWARIGAVETQVSPAGQSPVDLQLAVGADGTVVVAWLDDGYWAAVRNPVTGEWGPAHQLSDDEGEPRGLDIAVADEGTGYAVWKRNPGEADSIEAAILDPDDPTRSPGAPYQFQPVPDTIFNPVNSPIDTDSVGSADQPNVDVAPNGDATVVFRVVTSLQPLTRAVAFMRNLKPAPPDPGPPDPGPPDPGPGTPDPGPAGPVGPPAGPPPDLRAPRVSAFNSLRDVFAQGSKEGKVVAKRGEKSAAGTELHQPLRVGTKLRWTADEAGSARIVFTHVLCFTKHYVGEAVRDDERCNKRKLDGTVYTLRAKSKRGKNSVKYLGKTKAGKRLRIGGVYIARLVVTDAAGNPSVPRTLRLRVDEAARN